MAQTPGAHLVLDDTLGAMFIGVIVATALWGVSCVQTWHYYSHYKVDLSHIRFLVATAFISDTIHQMLITHMLYTYLVTNFCNPTILGSMIWSLVVEIFFNGLTAFLVQIFFTIRIWKLSQCISITLFVLLLVLAEFGVVLAYPLKALHFSTVAQLSELKSLSMTVNVLAAASDVVIAAVMCVLLHRSRKGLELLDTMIKKLMIFSVNTGLMTSVCAVLSLITISTCPGTFIYIAFYFTLGRLYVNSLLATLNARNSLRSSAVRPSNFSDTVSMAFREGPAGVRTGTGGVNSTAHASQSLQSMLGKTVSPDDRFVPINF
ncbi:hypothetical protein JAAARDRAFT_176614 [Jaapia argillacea MUCL 33604]|uniref:DUF6534 domain-containing protein n=1 Tax=Jaapia argillacea MUCL 33604 TaxID=933084 RepID=A0A067Q7L4_9AGAM|nr:hypothetical protein JAAARDRAFT_176614 [Jaapia argillacea MUCL 33604]